MKIKYNFASFIFLALITFLLTQIYPSKVNSFSPMRIAHAGGGIEKKTYTNSYEALNLNLSQGFTYFELDFSFTKDGQLVCLHDWEGSFVRSFGFSTEEAVTLDEFESLVEGVSKFTKCTLSGLANWLENNPQAIIITDLKSDNVKALRIIHEVLPDANRRVIPQIYQPENFAVVKEIGYENIIWTLYQYKGNEVEILSWVDEFYGSIAVTMPTGKASTALPKKLGVKNIATYVHTINKEEEKEKFINKFGITEIYTDFIIPNSISRNSKQK